MLIQRSDRPSSDANSTTSTLGRSGSDGRVDDPAACPRRTPEAWLGQVRHRDFAARRASWSSASKFALKGSLPAPCARAEALLRLATHSWTHPEGWRDWPFEAPATSRMRERCQFLRDVAEDFQRLRHERIRRRFFVMGATKLSCKECGADYGLEARYICDRCFGPLEVAYEHDVGGRRARAPAHPGRPAEHLALPRLPAAREGPQPRTRTGLPAGCTPLMRADRLAERLGLREVWVKNDAANPTHSFKDRVVSVASARARELGFTTLACASTGNLANSVAAHGAALGWTPTSSSRPTSRSRRSSPRACTARSSSRSGAPTTTSTGSAPSCRGERDWAFVNVNLRPYYAEGSKTLGLRDRRAARLGGARPRRGADRLGLALHEDRQGLPGLPGPRPRPGAPRS